MSIIQNIKDWLDAPAKAPHPKIVALRELFGVPMPRLSRRNEIAATLAFVSSVVLHIAYAIAHLLSTLMFIIVSAIVFVWVLTHFQITNPLVDYGLAELASFLHI